MYIFFQFRRSVAYEEISSNFSTNATTTFAQKSSFHPAIDDATAGMIVVLLLFIIPANPRLSGM